MIRTQLRVSGTMPQPTLRSLPHPAVADPTYLAMPVIDRLNQRLTTAHRRHCQHAWGVPVTFFFNEPPPPRHEPDWLNDCIDPVLDAVMLLAADRYSRRMARAKPGFVDRVNELATQSATLRQLADVLAVTDDTIVRVIHPEYQCGYRLHVNGIADLQQFQVLLNDATTGLLAKGLLPGIRPKAGIVDAYRSGHPNLDERTVDATYQFHTVDALRGDGTLPTGLNGCDHWLWDRQWLSTVPRTNDERTLLLGPPIVPRSWTAERRVPLVPGELRVLEVMSAEAVQAWIADRTGQSPKISTRLMRQAA